MNLPEKTKKMISDLEDASALYEAGEINRSVIMFDDIYEQICDVIDNINIERRDEKKD